MASTGQVFRSSGPRKSILDLAPLELDCMNTLWPLGEASVRQIQQLLAPSRPRAYTTIMTIMDRLAHKGVVTRRKVGRAYLYRPNLSAEEARAHAVEQVVEGFFDGSAHALAAHLAGGATRARAVAVRLPQARRGALPPAAPESQGSAPEVPTTVVDRSTAEAEVFPPTRLDESLL